MLHSGKCPKCESTIGHVKIESVELKIGRNAYKGITYLCPSCNSVLSASMDQLALTVDIANEVARRLGRG
jgi:uncharacterized protein with PIN domain